VQKDDLIIIACYAMLDEKEIISYNPKTVFVDEKNAIVKSGR
jgi:aspartate 1-decarboxylase